MTKCPICGFFKTKIYWKHKDMIIDKCDECQTLFQDPKSPVLNDNELITQIYEQYKESFENHISINISRIKKIEKITGIKVKNLKILEIGCGNGALGSILIDKKNDYWAFEAYPVFQKELARNKKLSDKVFFSQFDPQKIKGEKFDLIIANDVIEHVLDPLTLIKQLKNFVKEKGLIWIEVPDESYIEIKGLIRIITKMYVKGYPTNPDHKILFDKKTFLNFLKITGYKIKSYEIDSVWGDIEKLSVVFNGKIPFYVKTISEILKITSLDKIIGASIIGVLEK
ncbi:MAG TPA: class I SAM-dependent methyltransferase [Elusimicrobiales bacterium]|nr:class I SAM-dependent methyltransferase [Elusimicrobiales bacterium]HOL62630.1 class I SAM-dependent methyltransferase [Elusimicrobiales bacterium]HPO95401.1 class I SAM-dependent methyltransferase [Elusimicrobiales bacterium]